MARQGITKEQVFNAADSLLDEGTAATVQNVRDRIGSGSFTTISSHLAEWKDAHAGQVPANLPDIPEKVNAAFRQVWATAARTAQEDMDTQRQALEAMRREMEQDKAEAEGEIERLEQALEEVIERSERQAEELEQERKAGAAKDERITALTLDNARLDERVKAAEARGEELREQLTELQNAFAAASRTASTAKKPSRRAKPKAGDTPELDVAT